MNEKDAEHIGKAWTKDQAKARVFNVTTRDYVRLISKLEKTDKNFKYIFGHEVVKG